MKIKHSFIFFTISSFLFCFGNGLDITVLSAIYETSCNTTMGQVVFNLTYQRTQGILNQINPFDINMVLETNNTIETEVKCIHEQESKVFICTFNPEIEGTFHPKMDNDITIQETNEVLKAFDLINNKVGFSSDYVAPSSEKYESEIYIETGVFKKHYVRYEYESNLNAENLPTLTIQDKNFPCELDIDDKSILLCSIETDSFDIQEEAYDGYLSNTCGIPDAKVSLFVKEKPKLFHITVPGFSEETREVNCGCLKENVEVLLNFTCADNRTVGKEKSKINNKIKFVNKEDESIIIDTNCTIENKTLKCSPLSKAPANGKYYAVLNEDYLAERESGDFIINSFKTENEMDINQDYVPTMYSGYLYFSYDYSMFPKQKVFDLNIWFKEDIKIVPSVFMEKIPLECNNYTNILICKFNKIDFPPLGMREYITYNGTLMNVCGKEETTLKLQIKDLTLPSDITFTKVNFPSHLEDIDKNITFTVNFTTKAEIEYDLKIENLTLKNNETIIDLDCSNVLVDKYFTCTTLKTEPGTFNVVLKDNIPYLIYNFLNFTSKEEISFAKDYTRPVEKEINLIHDYSKQGNEGVIKIEFEDNLGEYQPIVKMEDEQIECKKENNFLNCPFNKKQFPTDKITEYYGNVINSINEIDATINLTVTCASAFIVLGKFVLLTVFLLLI